MKNNTYEIDLPGRGYFRAADGTAANPLDRILKELLSEDMERFGEMLERALEPQRKYLTETEYQIYQRGKKLRPMMLILSARLGYGDGPVPDKVIMAAVSLEMLHVATLIHDDIIDNALLRRGLRSVNATRGTNTAILVGDLQFVQAIRNFIDAIETDKEMGLVKVVLDTAFRICTGELDELDTDPNWSPEVLRERYFSVIERKTAIMFGLACETGLALANSRSGDSRRLGFYGRRVGRAFQVMDDVFDFLQKESDSGKKQGIDLAEGRLSLPIIYAMEALGQQHNVSRIVRGELEAPEDLRPEIEAVKSTDALTRAYSDARFQAIEALEYLKPFPKDIYREALEEIALFTVDRTF